MESIVDTVARLLSPPDNPNWHIYRGWARTILEPVAELKSGELGAALAAPDREITHASLARERAHAIGHDLGFPAGTDIGLIEDAILEVGARQKPKLVV